MQVDEQEASTSKPEAPKAEPGSYLLQNPARVTPAQERFISFLPEERWQPLRPNPPHSGILMLNDTRPGVPLRGCLPSTGATENAVSFGTQVEGNQANPSHSGILELKDTQPGVEWVALPGCWGRRAACWVCGWPEAWHMGRSGPELESVGAMGHHPAPGSVLLTQHPEPPQCSMT